MTIWSIPNWSICICALLLRLSCVCLFVSTAGALVVLSNTLRGMICPSVPSRLDTNSIKTLHPSCAYTYNSVNNVNSISSLHLRWYFFVSLYWYLRTYFYAFLYVNVFLNHRHCLDHYDWGERKSDVYLWAITHNILSPRSVGNNTCSARRILNENMCF